MSSISPSLLTRDCHFRTPVCSEGEKMQIDLTGAVACNLPLPSNSQLLYTKPVWADGNKRAKHLLFAPKRVRPHRLVQQLTKKPAAPEVWHHCPRFSDQSAFSVWLLLATFISVSISMGAALLHLAAVPVQ
jgi:hypothetical protein